jgi:hypothetical protein
MSRTSFSLSRNAILEEWLARTLRTYPAEASRFLLQEKDPFRNPVGHAIQQGLPVLFDQLVGDMDAVRITPALDEIVRIRAVQDFSPSQALAFLFLLKSLLREHLSDPDQRALLEARIDELALRGFDLYIGCREKLHEIKLGEAHRRLYLLEKMHEVGTGFQPVLPPDKAASPREDAP